MTTETTDATDVVTDEQWDAIDRRLDGNLTDDAETPRPDRRRVRILVLAAVGMVLLGVLGVLGVLAGWVFAGSLPDDIGQSRSSPASTAQVVIGFAGFGLTVVAWAVGAVVVVRRGDLHWSWREPTQGLPRAERRAVNDVLDGRASADPARTPSLRRVASTRLGQSGRALWMAGGLLPMSIGQAVLGWGDLIGTANLVLAVLWIAGIVSTLRRRRRLRAFLATHARGGGEPTPSS